jgi:type IX secretion system PorP/SprF family membrane protein
MKVIILFISILSITAMHAQQDFLKSQYMFNLFSINPAYAGSRDVLEASLSHRAQWVGFDGAPRTQVLTLHAPVTKKKIGFGLQLFNDRIGPRNVTGLNTSYAYHIKAGKGKIGFGLRASALNYTYNWNELNYANGQDVVIGQGNNSALSLNFDFGMYYRDRLQFGGFEVAHIAHTMLSPTPLEADLIPHFSGFYGRAFELKEKTALKASVLLRASKASQFADINLSAFVKQTFWLGMTYRTSGALVFIAEYYIHPQLRIAYSYDHQINGLANYLSGSHEVFLGYDIKILKTTNLSPRIF